MEDKELQRLMDKTKMTLFTGNNAAFLAPLCCTLEFLWDDNQPTACTNGLYLKWNRPWFISLVPDSRKTVLAHEIWHVARLHPIRCGSRDPKVWNQACDHRINLDLEAMGYTFVGIEDCCKDRRFKDMVEEDIYDFLIANPPPKPPPGGFAGSACPGGNEDGDMVMSADQNDLNQMMENVVQASQQAKASKDAGHLPGDIEEMISKFLEPVVPWQKLLQDFFTDLQEEDYTWARPNRRYPDMYLPSRYEEEGRLDHLSFYIDKSGSIDKADILRIMSEIKHIKDVFNPRKISLVQFDTRITKEQVILEDDPFEEIEVRGGGGTSLNPVSRHINETKPTAAVVLSDMRCDPMEPLEHSIPIFWIVIGNFSAEIPFGKAVFIRKE